MCEACGTASANIASASIDVQHGVNGVADEERPRSFRISPAANPARGATAFTLEMMRDGIVNVQMFSADGRRVADVASAWMPAGRHSLRWGALDRSGRALPPGVYLVRAKWGSRVALSRLVLLP